MTMVKVGCKLPHGLICELGIKLDGFNVIRTSVYKRVTLNGTNTNLIKGAPASVNQAPGITMVDEEFITTWLKDNKNLGFVKAKMIYIIANDAEGAAIAIDQGKLKTGFEPLDPSKAPKDIAKATKD